MDTDVLIFLIGAAAIVGTVIATDWITERRRKREAAKRRHPSANLFLKAELGTEDFSDTPQFAALMARDNKGYAYNRHLEKHWPYCPDDCPWRTLATTRPDVDQTKSFCSDCPDHEACSTGYPCNVVRTMSDRQSRTI